MKILSIGHLTYDINILVDNFPVEGTKNISKELISCSGGAANTVAYSLAKWNETAFISGVVGYDEVGNSMRKDMEANKVMTTYLEINYDIKTPTSYIIANKTNNLKTIITAETSNYVLKKYEYDQPMDCVVVDGSEYNASIYAFNKYSSGITILNAKKSRQGLLDFFKYAKYAVVSEEVAEVITGMKIDFNSPITMSNVYKKISEKYPNVKLVIRMDGKGVIYQVNNEIKVLADIKTDGIDKTGTHDIFVACLAYGLTNNYDLEVTLRLATIASSLSKNVLGATLSIPALNDIISYYESKFGSLKSSSEELTNNQESSVENNASTTQ